MTQYVRAINIANNSIKSFVFDTNTANTLDTAVVASAVAISANVSAQAVNTFVTLQVQQVANTPPSINVISITDSSYNVLDDTAANTTGAFLRITGTNFQSGAIVMVGSSNTAISTTFVDSSTLRAEIPAIAAGTYPVYVVNTNGGTAIRINGLTTSPFPAWSTGATLTGQESGVLFAISLSANSDSAITYSNTTALPAGTTLAANGLFSGTSSPASTTTFSFDVKATDAENQDASRTFSVTVTVPPQTRLYAWGYNLYSQLGLNDTNDRSSPTQVGTNINWNLISIGAYRAAATKTDGTLWMWGNNGTGELGLNDTNDRSSPTQIGSTTNWSQVDTGFDATIATKTNGTLWTWGGNYYGQLGNNNGPQGVFDQRPKSSPTQVGASTNWNKVSHSDRYTSLATKTDGTLWSWGRNHNGQLGLNDGVDRSSPTQVGTGTDWNLLCTSLYTTLAIKTNGTLWSWGSNSWGQLGLNSLSPSNRSSPVQVGSATNWSQVSGSWFSTLAIKTDGTLWSWGNNTNGQLGHNDRTYRLSPVQVGTATNWSLISVGNYAVTATKTDGTLWTWGKNNNGQSGKNDIINRSSPVQVGVATNWTQINAGIHNNLAIATN